MATADSTLQVDVVTTADLSGVRQVQAETSRVQELWAVNLNTLGKVNDEIKNQQGNWTTVARLTEDIERHLLNHVTHIRGVGSALAEVNVGFALLAGAAAGIVLAINKADTEERKFVATVQAANAEIAKTSELFTRMAQAVTSEEDLSRLATEFATKLDDANNKIAEFSRKSEQPIGFWHAILDLVAQVGAATQLGTAVDPFIAATQRAHDELLRERDALLEAEMASRQLAQSQLDWVDTLPRTQAGINQVQTQIEFWKQRMQEAQAMGTAGNETLTLRAKIVNAWYEEYNASKLAGYTEEQAQQNAAQAAYNTQRLAGAALSAKDAHKDLTAALREEHAMLQQIRAEQELTKTAPFMGADEKQVALLREYGAEMAEIEAELARISRLKVGVTDPVEMAQLNAQTLQLQNRWRQIAQEQSALMHPLQAQLQTWVNSWGTAVHQIGTLIEDTIGKALESLNTWITTGKFNLQSFMQQIEMLGLKLVEQLILQQAMALINSRINAELARITGGQIAAAMAPAATAATIATEGAAAADAPWQVALALSSVTGILGGGGGSASGGFHAGGEIPRFHNGGLSSDERLIVAQAGEIVMQRSVAQANRDFLLAMNAGVIRHRGGEIPLALRHSGGEIGRYHDGGAVGGSTLGGVHVYAFTDMQALLKQMASAKGQKVIFDTVKGQQINLGIG